TVKEYEEHVAFVALTYCQQVVNSLSLLKYEAPATIQTGLYLEDSIEIDELSSKEEALFEILSEGDLAGEKVIVYTRFASHVPRLQQLAEKNGIKSVAITGDIIDTDKNPRRRNAQQAFQTDDKVPV